MKGILERNGDRYLFLDLTPDISIDQTEKGCFVTKIISDTTIEIVPKTVFDTISIECQNALSQDQESKVESLKKFFNNIRDYHNPA